MNILLLFLIALSLSGVFAILSSVTIANNNAFFDHSLCHSLLLPTSISIVSALTKSNIYIINVLFCMSFSYLYIRMLKSNHNPQNILSFLSFISIGFFSIVSYYYQVDEESVEKYLIGDDGLYFIKIIKYIVIGMFLIYFYSKHRNILLLNGINRQAAFIQNNRIYNIYFLFLFAQSLFILELIENLGFFISYMSIAMIGIVSKSSSNNIKDFLMKSFTISFLSMFSALLIKESSLKIPFSSVFLMLILLFSMLIFLYIKLKYVFISRLSKQ